MTDKINDVGPIKLSVPNDPYYLHLIRHTVNKVFSDLGIDETTRNFLILSLDEACSNLMKHGKTKEGRCRMVTVTTYVCNKKITMEIQDYCCSGDVSNIKSPPCENLEEGGMGIRFIKQCMDKMELLENSNSMINLRLTKLL